MSEPRAMSAPAPMVTAATQKVPPTRRPRDPPSASRRVEAGTLPRWLLPVVVLALGTALGLWATAAVLAHRFDPSAVRNGAWTTWPRAGTADIDPYASAIQARTGEIPLAAAAGVAFLADRDSTGAPLSGRCVYRLSGPLPYARRWTLALDTAAGEAVDNAARRYAFTSADVLRREDGSFAIDVGSEVRPGNWLPSPSHGPFVLVLRLYESSLGATPDDLGTVPLPVVTSLGCAS